MMSGELQEPLFLNPLFANGDSGEIYQQLTMFPDPVRPLLIKSLQRKPENRFQDADEMLQALQRARSRLTVSFTTQTFEPVVPEELQPEPEAQSRFPTRLLAVVTITLVLLVVGAMATFGLVSGSTRSTPEPTPAPLVANPSPTYTTTAVPTVTATLSPTATATTRPSPSPTPSPSPSASAGTVVPPRVSGPVSLTLLLRDTQNAPGSVYAVEDRSTAMPITYLEGSYLWGEVATQIGSTVFKVDRDARDPGDPTQQLPPYLKLNIQYSGALQAAMRDLANDPPGFDASTGEFWVGRFRCGSAIPAESSPYRITIQLLEDGQVVARRQYVIGVQTKSNCIDGGPDDDSGGPPSRR